MATQVQHRQVGDTRIAIAAELQRPGGTAVNLTGLVVKFKMVSAQGVEKVTETTDYVSVVSASDGQVKYTFQDADVDTEETYFAYFTVYDGTEFEHFPAEQGDLRVQIHATG